MLVKEISKVLGNYLLFLTLPLCVPLAYAAYNEFLLDPATHPQPHSTKAFLYTIAICLLMATLLLLIGKKATGIFYRKEGLILVVLIWFLSALIGALPFSFSHTLSNPLDAYFEAISGFTTTGSSIMTPKQYNPQTAEEIPIVEIVSEHPPVYYHYYGTITPVRNNEGNIILSGVEAVSPAILLWRSFMQWLGGMGIVVLFVAILPAFGVGGKVLVETETPGPTKESVTPRIKDTASILWKLYLALTVLQVFLLMLTNPALTVFEAVTTTFATISTGGFAVHNAGIAAFDNLWTEWIIIIFMLLGSINFSFYFFLIRGKLYRLHEPELTTFLLLIIIGSTLVIWNLVGRTNLLLTGEVTEFTFSSAVRYGVFQYVSAQTSTGFAAANYNLWPFLSQALLLTAMFIGGMSGSTAGGIKIVRHYVLFRLAVHKIESIFRPDTVRALKVGDKEVTSKTAENIWCFLSVVVMLSVLATLLYIFDGIDPSSAIGLTACMINNIGLAFGAAGPAESCAFMQPFSKILSCFWMVLGRLEFFAVLILFIPAFWHDK